MRYFWLFNLVLCVVLTVASPQGASGKHTVLDLGDDAPCFRLVPQEVTFSPDRHRYKLQGVCDLLHTRLGLPVRVPFTVVGTYEPKTGETIESIDVPAPKINEPSRPYGEFRSKMHCNKDPWLNTKPRPDGGWYPDVQCEQRASSANPPWTAYAPGPVGDYAKILFFGLSGCATCIPYSAYLDEGPQKSLSAQYQTYLAAEQKAQQVLEAAKQPSGAYSALIHPSVLEPKAGKILAPQRPVPIKLAPPKGWRVNAYTVTIQRKDPKGNWVNHTIIPINAIVAHSPTGYTGFGGGAPPAFLMLPGKWRLNAQASSPNKSGVSDWVEFSAFESADFTAKKRKTPLPF